MKFIIGENRNQVSLLPATLEESIDPDNEVRLIDLSNLFNAILYILPEPTISYIPNPRILAWLIRAVIDPW